MFDCSGWTCTRERKEEGVGLCASGVQEHQDRGVGLRKSGIREGRAGAGLACESGIMCVRVMHVIFSL